MIRRMKILALALAASLAAMVILAPVTTTVESALLEHPPSSGIDLAWLLLASSIATLSIVRIGTSQQFSLNTLLARNHITVRNTHQFAANTVTVDSQLQEAAFTTRELPTASEDAPHTIAQPTQRSNSYERKAKTFNLAMAC